MKIVATEIREVLILEPAVHGDARGFFMESYSKPGFDEAVGRPVDFPQDNHSRSQKGVLRGLHFQRQPRAQGKLVRAARGAIFDVAVDIRRSSPTFGRWVGAVLSEENKRQLWVPEGFAHGFLTLSDSADVLYKSTDTYAPETEGSVRWDDPAIAIDWPLDGGVPLLSAKDEAAPSLSDARLFD